MDFVPSEKGQTIRQPATANLMLDSQDRDVERFPFTNDFTISKNQSILNGFFTRLGTTEVVMDWGVPNVSADASNNFINMTLGTTRVAIPLAPGFYNAFDMITTVAKKANDLSGTTGVGVQIAFIDPVTFGGVAFAHPGNIAWVSTGGNIQFHGGGIGPYLFPGILGDDTTDFPLVPLPQVLASTDIDLRKYRYLDIVSENLTYNQDLKDDATNRSNRNVLCRWYMSYDNPEPSDEFGYPVRMGYRPFELRRIFNPPKQIRWDARQPVGQVSLQVYCDDNNGPGGGNLWPDDGLYFDYLMTIQASEN